MLLNGFRRRLDSEEGFTLIELMVVCVNIGVLIAIALPTFLGARNRAQNRRAQVDLRNTVVAARTAYTDNVTYAGASTTGLPTIEPALTYLAAGTASAVGNNYGVSVATGAVNGVAEPGVRRRPHVHHGHVLHDRRRGGTRWRGRGEHLGHLVRHHGDGRELHRDLGAGQLRADSLAVAADPPPAHRSR